MRMALEEADDPDTILHPNPESGEHPLLTSRKDGVDINLNMLWDYNHVISFKMNDGSKRMSLIPTTMHEDMVLLHKKCRGCWSMHGMRWHPDVDKPVNSNLIEQKMDFLYMMHLYDATLSGKYWMINVCLDSDIPVCGVDFITYAVEKATPWFNILGDGYVGLAPRADKDLLESVRNNVLDQMHHKNMIQERVFGVHTHMYNSTEDPSQMRFGGYNKDLIREGKEIHWFQTTSKKSWGLNIHAGGLHTNLFHQNNTMDTHAVIEPGYPYIAMPKK